MRTNRPLVLLAAGKDRIGQALARYDEERKREAWLKQRREKAGCWSRAVERIAKDRAAEEAAFAGSIRSAMGIRCDD